MPMNMVLSSGFPRTRKILRVFNMSLGTCVTSVNNTRGMLPRIPGWQKLTLAEGQDLTTRLSPTILATPPPRPEPCVLYCEHVKRMSRSAGERQRDGPCRSSHYRYRLYPGRDRSDRLRAYAVHLGTCRFTKL